MKQTFLKSLCAGAVATVALTVPNMGHAGLLSDGPETIALQGDAFGDTLKIDGSVAFGELGSLTTRTFTFDLTNNSDDYGDNRNRMVSFGFDVLPANQANVTGATSDDGDWGVSLDSNITNGFSVDICVWDGVSCQGGQNQGLFTTDSLDALKITLNGDFVAPLSFENFTARFQSVGEDGEGSTAIRESGDNGGGDIVDIPSPATLGLLGFMLIGVGFTSRALARRANKTVSFN